MKSLPRVGASPVFPDNSVFPELSDWYAAIGNHENENLRRFAKRGQELLTAATELACTHEALQGVMRRDSGARSRLRSLLAHSALREISSPQTPMKSGTPHVRAEHVDRATCELFDPQAFVDLTLVAALLFRADRQWSAMLQTLTSMSGVVLELHDHMHLCELWLRNRELRPSLEKRMSNMPVGPVGPAMDPMLDTCPVMLPAALFPALVIPDPQCGNNAYETYPIDGIDQRYVCSTSDVVTLVGQFPVPKPQTLDVIMATSAGYRRAHLAGTVNEAWTADRIRIRVPASTVPGCIWLYDREAANEYLTCRAQWANALGQSWDGLGLSASSSTNDYLEAIGDMAPDFRLETYFEGVGSPTFSEFRVGNQQGWYTLGDFLEVLGVPARVWSGRPCRIEWLAERADHVEIIVRKTSGAVVVHQTRNGTAFAEHLEFTPTVVTPELWDVELRATNNCTSGDGVVARMPLLVQPVPQIRILGVEVTQATQRFDPHEPSSGNNVSLVRGRQTVFRAYVESGIPLSAEPGNMVDSKVRVLGSLSIDGEYVGAEDYSNCWAWPAAQINRGLIQHSLNFVVPGAWVKEPANSFQINVRVVDPVTGAASELHDDWSEVVHMERLNRASVWVVVYDDTHLDLKVSRSDAEAAIEGLLRYLPLADNGVRLHFPSAGLNESTDRDLTKEDGWDDLLSDLENFAEEYDNEGQRWLGVLPRDHRYALGGKGTTGWAFVGHPVAVSQAVQEFVAHEICHTYGIRHAPCGTTEFLDSRLEGEIPDGRTEDFGVDVHADELHVLSPGRGDLMSECRPRWTSIALWHYMFSILA